MRKLCAVLPLFTLFAGLSTPAIAQEGESWETQETVYNVTMIRVHPNMDEQYLNNLKRTWVTGVEAAIAEGLTTDYNVYQTITTNDEGYNLILVTEHPNLASFDATAEWRAKIQRIGDAVETMISEQETDRITSTVYPQIRDIVSAKLVREIKFIDE
jgi:hypothetical protein